MAPPIIMSLNPSAAVAPNRSPYAPQPCPYLGLFAACVPAETRATPAAVTGSVDILSAS